ncbi:MAG: hypothetical protein K8R89_08520 [Anaerolineae bacterium]|nr:hypothetical protein [Anaerolineae bacterium]
MPAFGIQGRVDISEAVIGELAPEVAGTLAVLLLVLLAAGIVDLVRLWEYRTWGYRVAESAALARLANSRDYAGYMATGELSLDAGVAQQDAVAALGEFLAQRADLTGSIYDVRVHASAAAAVYAGLSPGRPCGHGQRGLVAGQSGRGGVLSV